jgi:hypothetical protein
MATLKHLSGNHWSLLGANNDSFLAELVRVIADTAPNAHLVGLTAVARGLLSCKIYFPVLVFYYCATAKVPQI